MVSITATRSGSRGSSIPPDQRDAGTQVTLRSHRHAALLALIGTVAVAATLSAQDLSRYRDIPLGATLADVMTTTRSAPAAVSNVHSRPRLIQDLSWRPRYMPGGSGVSEAVREVIFSFVDNQLFRIVVRYDAHEVEGLTTADLIAALSISYGTPVGKRADALAVWERNGVSATLSDGAYPSPYHLTFLSAALGGAARTATAEAERLDRVEGPARQAALDAEAATERAREAAATRSKNKAVFRP